MAERHHLTDDMVTYLEKLRDTGNINMMGAGPYLEREFDMNRQEAKLALKEWMFG